MAYGLLLSLVWVQAVRHRRRIDRGGDRRRADRRAADRRRGAAARHRGGGRSERSGIGMRRLAKLLALGVTAVLMLCVLALPEPAPTLAPRVVENMAATGCRQPDHRRAARLPRAGHDARGDRAGDRAHRRLVAGARALLGRPPRAAPPSRPRRRARLPGAGAAADRHHRRRLHLLGRCRPSRRQVPERHHPGGDVDAGADGRARRHAAGRQPVAARRHRRRPAGVRRRRPGRRCGPPATSSAIRRTGPSR